MATLRTITDFRSKLSGGGARANLFEVDLTFPSALSTYFPTGDNGAGAKFKFLCKAAQLPSSNVSPIEIPFRGRTLKVAGDRTFDPWTVTIINDEDFKIRTSFEQWMNELSRLTDAAGMTDPAGYQGNANVVQLGRGYDTINRSTAVGNSPSGARDSARELRKYQFEGIFPTNVSAIDVSYDSADTIEEFTVEFQVQYWTAIATTGGGVSAPAIS